jgi:cell shape-determining protein MreC
MVMFIDFVRLLQDGYPKDYFVGLVDLEHAHADGVFTAIDTAMNNHGSLHWKEKVVGGGSDGASVNIGKNNSVLVPDKFVGLIDFSSRDSAIVLNSLSALGE